VDIPAPPRGGDEFREFYASERNRMIALARLEGGGRIHDPEQVAETGWQKFYPHWKNCRSPEGLLRVCVLNTARDELRSLKDAPVAVPIDLDAVELSLLPDPVFASLPPKARDRISIEIRAGLQRAHASQGAAGAREPDIESELDPELVRALVRLSPERRQAVLLDIELDIGERLVKEIAGLLGIEVMAARMRLRRAYRQLKKLLPADYLEVRYLQRRSAPAAWEDLRERPAP
jgi:DNA-directed RNA polymerase specialized sigma24 family protein